MPLPPPYCLPMLSLLAAFVLAAAPLQDTAHVVLVATTDVHGRATDWDYVTDRPFAGGIGRVATVVVDLLRAKYPGQVLVADAGDLLQGDAFATYFARVAPATPHPIVEALNLSGYDAATPGSHDFDWGLPFLRRAIADARFSYISANVFSVPGDSLLLPAYRVLRRQGVGTHFYRADRPDPPSRRAPQAQRQPRRPQRKRVILVDNSIVRGTTSMKIVEWCAMPGRAKCTCAYQPADELSVLLRDRDAVARSALGLALRTEQMARHIGADSLGFVSIDGLYRAMGDSPATRGATLLRRLLYRGLSDPPGRRRRGQGFRAAVAADRTGVNPGDRACGSRREQRLHRFFEITLLLKALFAAGEIVAAIGVYVVPLDTVAEFVGAITSAELAKHPHDLVAAHLADWAQNLSIGTKHFVAFYLLTRV